MTDVIVFDSFQGGERGAASRYEPNTVFTGNNVVVLPDGSLASRPGWEQVAITLGSGDIRAAYGLRSLAGAFLDSTGAIRRFNFAGNLAAVTGTVNTDNTAPTGVVVASDQFVYLAGPGNGIYRHNVSANTVVLLANAGATVAGGPLALWRSFLVSARSSRLYWSDANPDSWPASPNFVEITGQHILAIGVIRDSLYVYCRSGKRFAVIGELTTSTNPDAVYRVVEVMDGFPVMAHQSVSRVGSQAMLVCEDSPFPTMFTGSFDQDLTRYRMVGWATSEPTTYATVQSVALSTPNDAMVVGTRSGTSTGALLLKDGVWTRQTFPVRVDYFAPTVGGNVFALRQASPNSQLFIWRASNYESVPDGNGYGFKTTDAGSIIANSARLQEIVGDGRDFVVRAVSVDFRPVVQVGGTDGRQEIGCQVLATRRSHDLLDLTNLNGQSAATVGEYASAAKTWRRDFPNELASNRSQRYVFRFGEQGAGAGAVITLANIRGVRIERVVAHVEKQGAPR